MEHLLFAAYLILFAWLVTKVNFFIKSGLTAAQLIIFFLLKVLAGIFYGWVGVYYGELAQMVDTWGYHYESLKEYQLLIEHPEDFFSNLISSNYESGYSGFFSSQNSWWNDLKGTSFLKLLAFFNVFSFGNYYVNVIFYSFLSLFGPVAVYRIMKNVFVGDKLPVLLATFLVPSFLYWTSGIHKDGIIFLGFAMILYNFYFGLKETKLKWHRVFFILLGLLIVLALRNFLIIIIIPALVAWFIAVKVRFKPLVVFSIIYFAFIVLFFTSKHIHTRLNFPIAVVAKQQAFLQLKGGSAVDVRPLKPELAGFIKNAPQALSISTIRPYPADVRHLLSLAASLEINFLLFLFVISLIWRRKGSSAPPFLFLCIFLSFSVLMMIGYTVNFLGAVVRYRSIILPFLIVPVVAQIDWSRIKSIFFKLK